MMYTNLEVRAIIHNAHKIKEFNKCPLCNATGYVNWNGNTGDDLKAGKSDDKSRDTSPCHECEGLGYVDILMYE